jgi:uncharacterized protein YcfJ
MKFGYFSKCFASRLTASKVGVLGLTTAALILGVALSITGASAETRIETVIGTVIQSDAIKSSYIRKTPQDERICRTQDVPIYGTAKNGQSDLGAMIVGGLIGSAIGNKLSDKDGAGAAGTVAGAIIGREHAKNNQQGPIVGYRQENVCEVQTVMTEQTVEEITGYRNRIEVDGRIVTIETARPFNRNDRVEITRQITYSLR